jgi:hypothetical protein
LTIGQRYISLDKLTGGRTHNGRLQIFDRKAAAFSDAYENEIRNRRAR